RHVGEAEHVAGQLTAGASQDRLHPRHHLGEAERLRHVVVAARTERVDLALDSVLRSQEQDRGLEAPFPQPAADLDAFEVGEHPATATWEPAEKRRWKPVSPL